MEPDNPLELFHPLVGKWFEMNLGVPTPAQREAWPQIASKRNVLVTAPTGSGKTLTAFLWAIDRLIRGAWSTGKTRVLYVSPLRALNNDIRRNLTTPLLELEKLFEEEGDHLPTIRAMTRSGDTSKGERRKMLRSPPEILITTPESLNILLTSKKGTEVLRHLETVILDEVHAVAGSKRGTHLITAVERLTRLSGEFQRIALSATVNPMEKIADWVGGYRVVNPADDSYAKRPVVIIDAGGSKKYDIEVCHAQELERPEGVLDTGSAVWFSVADEVGKRVEKGESTLVFANSRRAVERMARLVNDSREERLVYSHHGSLAREIREVVEKRLKRGELRGIVATNSLELGIDVGAVNQVVLVETPPSISSTVQRIGRAGHGVGQTSVGRIYPLHPMDYIDAAIATEGLSKGEVEPLKMPKCPLDVLTQVILSMTSTETWRLDDLFEFIKTASPYRDLPRRTFDLVVEMLAGKYEGSHVPQLKPRAAVDRVDGTIVARSYAARLLYASGGTIPDRGYYTMRITDTGTPVGELDEEFVWERSQGERVSLGVQSWKIDRIGLNDVFVTRTGGKAAAAPFWRSEERFHDFFYAERRGAFLEGADGKLDDPAFLRDLEDTHHFTGEAAGVLRDYLLSQKKATECSLPHRHHVVVEQVAYPRSTGMRPFTVLHTQFGGHVNRPLALALGAALEQKWGGSLETLYEDGCVALEMPESPVMSDLLDLLSPGKIESLIRSKLESTGFFGAHFRENAARSLLLLKAGFKKRTPLWLNRQRAKDLMSTVSKYEDFPVLLETWRSCMQDEVDIENLQLILSELRSGDIEVSHVKTTNPSPFAAQILWKRTNELMYDDDTPESGPTALKGDLIDEVVFSPTLRPRIRTELIEILTQKLHRTYPGYSPRDGLDLIEWTKERVLIPAEEWGGLLQSMQRDWRLDRQEILRQIQHRVVALRLGEEGQSFGVCSVEAVHKVIGALGLEEPVPLLSAALDGKKANKQAVDAASKTIPPDTHALPPDSTGLAEFLAEWLRFYGPVPLESIETLVCKRPGDSTSALAILEDDQRVVVDEIEEDGEGMGVIDGVNLARLLRMTRSRARPETEARPITELPLFLRVHHGLGAAGSPEALETTLEKLFGYAESPHLFEEEILPARLKPYQPAWLDSLLSQTDLLWTGAGDGKLTLCLESDRELFAIGEAGDGPPDSKGSPKVSEEGFDERSEEGFDERSEEGFDDLLPAGPGRYTFAELAKYGESRGVGNLSQHIWSHAFAGRITNDTFEAVRQGIALGFKHHIPHLPGPSQRTPRSRSSRWRSRSGMAGNWYRLPGLSTELDAVDIEELQRDRARMLLDRYGIVFRELLGRESGPLKWGSLFRSLRLMELSGEVIAGAFFDKIPGVQFISTEGFKRLEKGLPGDEVFWVNAKDPLSPCGLGIEGFEIPRRIPSNHLVFQGSKVVLVSMKKGKDLDIRVPPDHPELPQFFAPIAHLLTREARPLLGITIETINKKPAASSPYRPALEALFDTTRDQHSLRVTRRYEVHSSP